MIPDLSSLSIEELNDVISRAESLIAGRKDAALRDAYAEIVSKAATLGVSLEELLEQGARGSRKPVAVRYRNPENPEETWTGRGKQPRWLAARIAAGQSLESFAV